MVRHFASRFLAAAIACIVWSLCQLSVAADWPQWRGPNRDGISAEKGWTTQWPEKGPKVLWKAKVGNGRSSFAVVGTRVYTMGFELDKPGPDGKYKKDESGARLGTDFVWCLDAGTGEVVWKHSYPSSGDETYSTPTVQEGRVYTLGRLGQLLCLDAASGRVLWSKDLVKDFAAEKPYYGYACSSLVAGDLLVVECGGKEALVLGLEAKTGQLRWKCGKGPAGFSSPLLYQSGGKAAVLMFTPAMALGINIASGEELWQYKWKWGRMSAVAMPIVQGDRVLLCGSGSERLSVLLELKPGGPKEIWKNESLATYFQSDVLLGGHLYGTHNLDHIPKNASLRCVRFDTGEVKWEKEGFGHAPLMAADGKLIIMEDRGSLIVAEASPKEFKELARAKVLDGECWTCPVLCGGRVYCRNHRGDIVCMDVKGQ